MNRNVHVPFLGEGRRQRRSLTRLAGYEVREYLLEKWQRRCAYCGKTNVPLQIEHIVPKARGGTNRSSNLALACEPCNTAKGTSTAAKFGHPEVQVQAKVPLRDATAVNTTRWALYRRLRATGLPLETGTGGRTKWNRTERGLPKAHWIDAVCVGASTPGHLSMQQVYPLLITATGHGTRQLCGTDQYGFPIRHRRRQKQHQGFQTGDMVTSGGSYWEERRGTHRARDGAGKWLVRHSNDTWTGAEH